MDAPDQPFDYQKLLHDSISLGEAALTLGLPSHELRRRIHDRALCGLQKEGVWYLPRFQFVDGKLVPGLELVLPAVGYGAHPLELHRWFTTPHDALRVGDDRTRVSPAQWLASGGRVEDVVGLADEVTSCQESGN
jgi:hypothetical protein